MPPSSSSSSCIPAGTACRRASICWSKRCCVPLSAGRVAQVPRYDWLVARFIEPWPLEHPELLIVEGVGAGARAAASFASVLVWLELDAGLRKERALARDGEVFRPHWERWAEQEDVLLAREQTPARADFIVDTA